MPTKEQRCEVAEGGGHAAPRCVAAVAALCVGRQAQEAFHPRALLSVVNILPRESLDVHMTRNRGQRENLSFASAGAPCGAMLGCARTSRVVGL